MSDFNQKINVRVIVNKSQDVGEEAMAEKRYQLFARLASDGCLLSDGHPEHSLPGDFTIAELP